MPDTKDAEIHDIVRICKYGTAEEVIELLKAVQHDIPGWDRQSRMLLMNTLSIRLYIATKDSVPHGR